MKNTTTLEKELRKEVLALKVSLSNARVEVVEAKANLLGSVSIVAAAIELNTEYMDHPWAGESVHEAGKHLFEVIKDAGREPRPMWQREYRGPA